MDVRNKLCKTALMTVAGLGLLIVVTRKRRFIFNCFKTNVSTKRKRIAVIQNIDECQKVVKCLQNECSKFKVVGFDCEWVTVGGTRRPTALLQLSSGDELCALFRLCCMKQIPKSLRDLLEDDSILKVGIAPQADAQKLAHDYGVGVASTFDLRFLAILTGHKAEGLAKMSKSILDVELDKHWRLICSDWETKILTEKQLQYAANDAFVAVEIFKKLSRDLIPKSFWQLESNFESVRSKLEPFLEVNFKEGFLVDPKVPKHSQKNFNSISKNDQNNLKKSQVKNINMRSKPLYDNCLLEAPDGELLCTIDRRKAQWYLDQCLGIEIMTEPLTVRLNFEPASRAKGEVGKYYQTAKENQCVVCGQKELLLRKNVIPREYRKHFPEVMKSHTSHDVLLLCYKCHQLSNISDLKLRRKLSQICNVPLIYKQEEYKSRELIQLKQVRSSARALIKFNEKIPDKRRKSLESIILKHYKETEISYDLLQEASEINTKEDALCFKHGEEVVKKFQSDHGGLLELEKIWREHFISAMQPKYLPPLWNINHNASRLEIKASEGRLLQKELTVADVILEL